MTYAVTFYAGQIAAAVDRYVAEVEEDDGHRTVTAVNVPASEWANCEHPGSRGLRLGHDPLVADNHDLPTQYVVRYSAEVIAERAANALITREGGIWNGELYSVRENPSECRDLVGAYMYAHFFMWDATIARWDPAFTADDQTVFALGRLTTEIPDFAALVDWIDEHHPWTKGMH